MTSTQILWSSATRFHDWVHGELPGRLLAAATEAGVIGPAERIEADALTAPRPRRVKAADLAAALSAGQAAESASVDLEARGSKPRDWKAFITLFPVEDDGRVRGYSMINLQATAAGLTGEAGSAALMSAFRAAYAPGDAEFAMIHPLEHSRQLSGATYRPPVLFSPMLDGAYWATFLGRGHLEEFAPDRLRAAAGTAWRHEWVEGGLFLFAGPDVAWAETEEGEAELLRLTEALRGALRSP